MKKALTEISLNDSAIQNRCVVPIINSYERKRTLEFSYYKSFFLLFAFILFWGMVKAQTTVTYVMQDANFPTQFNDGGDFFNQGSSELGMWANTGSKNTVAWRTFKIAGDNTGSNRALQVGDVFKITVYCTRARGQIGFSLNAGGIQGSNYDNRVNGSRLYCNTDNYGSWYVNRSGGNTVLGSGYNPIQNTFKDYTFTVRITSSTSADVYLTVDGIDYRAYNMTMNGNTNIDAFSIYGSDIWDGDSNDNAYWKQTSTVTNSQRVEVGYNLASGNFTPGVISDGLDAGSTSTVSVNNVYVGGNTGSAIILNQANSYTGNTTVNTNATLTLGAAGVIPDASNMVLDGGTFKTGASVGYNETVGTLTVSNNSTIALGTGSHTLNFGASNGNSWTSGKTITITGWAGTEGTGGGGTSGKIYFGATSGTLTEAQLSKITFNGFPNGSMLKSDGELVPAYSPAPTTNATVASFTNVGRKTITFSWTNGNGANRIVLVKSGSAVDGNPANGTTYTSNTTFTGGTQIGTGNYVVYSGSGSTVTVNGFTAGTTYYFAVFECNGSGSTISYFTSGQLTANQATTNNYLTVASGSNNWSSTTAWFDNEIPSSGSDVIVRNTLTLDQNVSVSSLTVNAGATFTASDATSRTLTITKSATGNSATLSNSGTWTNGTGGSTVVFTGAPGSGDAIHAVSGTIAFQNITVNKTGGASNVGTSFGTGSSVSGTMEIGSGGFVSTAPPSSFYGTNAILKFNQGSGATYSVNSGDYSWSTTQVPNNISISSGTVNLNSDRTAIGNLLIDGGALVLNAGTPPNLTIQGNWTRSSGSFTANTGTVTMSGSTDGIIDVTGGASMYDLVINKNSGKKVTLACNITVSHALTISGGSLIVPDQKQLTVLAVGTLTNTSETGLVIESGGSLIQSSGSVKATVKRAISAWGDPSINHGWHFLSSPVDAQAISPGFTTVTANEYDFFAWWEPTNVWVNYKNTTIAPTWATGNVLGATSGAGNFIPGKGYLVEYLAASTKEFSGTLNNANITVSNLAISSGTNKGWHLLGNPFTSAITWATGWSLNHINTTAKIWNESSASYHDVLTGEIIPALNGFMVQVVDGFGGTNSLTIPTSARTHNATGWYKSTDNPTIVLLAHDLTGQTAQESIIRFSNEATAGFDPAFDSHFLPGYAPLFYSVAGTDQLSTNALPQSGGNVQIPFSFVKNDGASFTIEAKKITDINGPVILKDLKTNTTQDLTVKPVYSFTSSASDDPNRFLLTFSHVGIGENTNIQPISVYTTGNSVYVSNKTGSTAGTVYVYNMMGQLIMQQKLTSDLTAISVKAGTGYYLVKVISGNQVFSGKVFINQ
ncbi:MAG: T9SS type A sorting domain-containing protein [Bacteroidota bacterium]